MTIDAGANLNFEFGTNASLFDSLNLVGGLTIDGAGNSILNLAGTTASVSFITPSTYTLINANGGIASNGAGSGTLLFPNASQDETLFGEQLHLQTVGNLIQVVVTANAVQWDPDGQGATRIAGGMKPNENNLSAFAWTDGSSTFVDYSANPATEYTWSNGDAKDVIIGNDVTQAGGDITLGSNITTGKITFGPIFAGANYRIADNGSGNVLTIMGGISVNNNAATSTTPSAEIDAPIALGADQSWNVDSGQFFDVKSVINGAGKMLTKVGSGVVEFEAGGGSLGQLNVNQGIVLMGQPDSLGASTPITLNGGGVEYAVDGTPLNPITLGANGGSLGATSATPTSGPHNVTFTNNITGAFALTAIGTGNVTFAGNLTIGSFVNSTSTAAGGGITTLSGNNTFNSVSITSSTLIAGSPGSLGAGTTPIALSGSGTLSLPGWTNLPNPVSLSGGGNVTISGNVSGSGGLSLSGAVTGGANLFLVGPEFTFTNSSTDTASYHLATTGMIVHTNNLAALGRLHARHQRRLDRRRSVAAEGQGPPRRNCRAHLDQDRPRHT